MDFDPMQIFFFILRAVPVIIVILLAIYAIFSFKVEVHTQSMERLNVELAENILVSDMAAEKSIFNAKKLYEIVSHERQEKEKDEKYNIQPKPRLCEYGYHLSINGLEEKYCENAVDCKNFCMNACNLSESEITNNNCKCETGGFLGFLVENKCEYKCSDGDWSDKYDYEFGYEADETEIQHISIDYPAGIYEDLGQYKSSASPAKMTLELYDSWLTRMACMAELAYTQKRVQEMVVSDFSKFGYVKDCDTGFRCITLKKFDDYVCTYKAENEQFKTKECIYSETPVITFFARIYGRRDINSAILTAYPIKKSIIASPTSFLNIGPPKFHPKPACLGYDSDTNCVRIKDHPEYVATKSDEVGAVIFCLDYEGRIHDVDIPSQLACG